MYILPLNEIGPGDGPRVGGKAAGLARLIAAGFDVPAGFCVTTEAFRAHLDAAGIDAAPEEPGQARRCDGEGEARSAADPGEDRRTIDAHGVPTDPGEVRRRVEAHGVPAPVEEAILAAYRALTAGRAPIFRHARPRGGAPAARVAVRSSAEAEDLPAASFAGQYDTVLDVASPEGLLTAVRRCWASLWSDRALVYRRQAGLDPARAGMAVVVQRMVPAEVSGVVFTVNPVTGNETELLVNARRGLGEALVSGRVTPEEFVLARATGKRLRSRPAVEDPPEGDAPPGSALAPAPAARAGRPCLSARRLKQLARLCLAVERHFGAPQDLEWALHRGSFRLLQARPVTAARRRPLPFPVIWGHPVNAGIAPNPVVFWSNWNTRENMPYPLKPLAWSYFNDVLVPPITRTLWGIDERSPLYRHSFVIDLVDGRAYWNMNLLFGHPFLGRLAPTMLRLLDPGTGESFERLRRSGEFRPARPPVPRTALAGPVFRAMRAFFRFPWLVGPPRIQARCDAYWELAAEYETLPLDGRSVSDLIGEIRRFSALTTQRIFPVLVVSLKFVAGFALVRRLTRRMPDVDAGDLLVGIPGNRTTEGALELFELSRMPEDVRRVFRETDLPDLERALAGSAGGRAFLGRLEAFLDRHGHRGTKDLDIGCPSWKEDRTYVYQRVRDYLQLEPGDAGPPEQFARSAARRRELTARIERRLAEGVLSRVFPLRRWLFRRALRLAHDFLPWRENEKYYGVRGFPGTRRILREIGRRLVAAGHLDGDDDVFFLSFLELAALERAPEPDPAGLRALVGQRRAEWERQVGGTAPDVLRSDGRSAESPSPTAGADRRLKGVPASSGVVTGRARVVREPSEAAGFRKGDILVAPYTEPGWAPIFLLAGGLVMDVGGAACHGAIVAREYGIPAVVGTRGATRSIRDGDTITVDGDRGEVRLGPAHEP